MPPRGKIEAALGAGIHIAHLISHIPLPTQMDDHPSSINRRKKSDKAKEKCARTPYSSQHVRQVVAKAAAVTAMTAKPKHK